MLLESGNTANTITTRNHCLIVNKMTKITLNQTIKISPLLINKPFKKSSNIFCSFICVSISAM